MSFIHLILNLVGLLLWLKWRDPNHEVSGPKISLLGTLRKVGPRQPRIWFFIALIALLAVRPLIYRTLGSALNWMPQISLGVIALPFRSDLLGRMFLFSFFSFGATLGIFYLCLILLSILNSKNAQPDPMQNLVCAQLGKFHLLPAFLKLILPWFAMFASWVLLNKPLVALGILPAPKSFMDLFEHAAVVGLGVYLAWEYVIVGILLLHLLNSYVYFGAWPIWTFIDNSARQILKLFSWIPLRVGKIDFAPIVVMAIIIFAAEYSSRGLVWVYQKIPM